MPDADSVSEMPGVPAFERGVGSWAGPDWQMKKTVVRV